MFYHSYNIGHLFERKDHLIKRLDLTDEQKEKLIAFFNKYPNYESKIDWNNQNLTWEDFSDLLDNEGKSKSQAKRKGLEGLKEGIDYQVVVEDPENHEIIYKVLTHLGSKTLASDKVGDNVTAHWCISMNGDQHWKNYTYRGYEFYFIIRDKAPIDPFGSEKVNFNFILGDNKNWSKIALCVKGKKVLDKLRFVNQLYTFEPTIIAFDALDRILSESDKEKAFSKVDKLFVKDLQATLDEECKNTNIELDQKIKASLTGGKKLFYGNMTTTYNFNRPTKKSLYVRIMKILRDYGPMSKRAVLTELARIGAMPNHSKVWIRDHYENTNPDKYWGEASNSLVRGQYAGVFSAMRQAGLTSYNKETRKLSLGPNAELYMDYHKDIFK